MLLSKEVEVSVLNNNRNYLEKSGYDISQDKVLIKIEDLSTGSKKEVLVQCDVCQNVKSLSYYNYNKSLNKFGIYCCSSSCSTIKKKKTNLEKFGSEWASQSEEVKDKVKNSNLEKWGVECTLQSEEIKEKTKRTNFEKFGSEWASQSEEIKEKTKKTNLKKWGTEFILNLPEIRNKIKNSNLEKWGFENPMQNSKIREKVNITKLERWGDPNYNNRDKFKLTSLLKWGKFYTQTDEYKLKSKKSNLEKWGVEYVMQSDLVKEKSKLTKLERWGDPNYNNPDKRVQTNLERWGVEYPTQNSDIWNKIERTNLKNWGVKTILKHGDIIEKRIKSYNENNKKYVIDKYSEILSEKYTIKDYFSGELIIEHGDHQFHSSLQLIYDRLNYSKNCEVCTICNPINSNSSSHENEIADWLESFTEVERRKRNLIQNREIDIYLPDKKLAIEFNGLYWHSELFKNKWYHLDKTKRCSELDIKLIHVFEDDWIYRKEIIKSIILNKMNLIEDKIWARKCYIKEIGIKECKKFLIENHIQGYSNCKYKLGLFKDGELVSVMTLGTRKTNSKSEFELIRFCNKININVVGAASKLLNYFIKEYKWSGKIVSYADISIFSGNLYEKLGFQNIHLSKPNYYWVIGDKRYHRFKYNKKKLVNKFGSDANLSETQIMNNWGYHKIWSCGQVRYEKQVQ
jgi:hypothetical protein